MKLALAIAFAALATPLAAAEADVSFLQRLAGNWHGSGKLTGEETGNVDCRLAFKPNGSRLTYTGRCGLAGEGSQSFQGTIVYNEAAQRYEARSSGQTATSKRTSNTLTFAFDAKNIRGTVSSTMRLSPSALRLDFRMVNGTTRGVSQSRISFSKS